MAINPLKAFLFAGGGVVAVAGTAYVAGAFDPLLAPQPPAQVAALPAAQQPADTVTTPATGSRLPAASATTQNAAEPPAAAVSPAPAEKTPPPAAPAATQAVLPTFDVVRVEGDGSVVIAGNAAAKAKVEALNGATVLGAADAGPDGAFAIVPDTPLKPGDYQITLRATAPDGTVAASTQTAVVSVPEKPDGQVLAMVEEPGKPAELMAVPKPDDKPASAAAQPSGAAPAETKPAETKPAETASAPASAGQTETAAAPVQSAESSAQADAKPAAAEPGAVAAPAAKVVVEAVEIDGAKVFVAGIADAGRKVRAYANEILLGDAMTSPDGHFLVEAKRDLPVGTYTVRVDALDADGAKVVARATVPFEREPGQAIAAVAPAPAKPETQSAAQPSTEASSTEPAKQPAGTQPAASEKPAEVAAATPPADGVPETVSPKLEHANSAVIIRRKDTLWRISRRVYGHGTRYSTIYLANQDQISDPDKIWPGQVFKLPEKSREGEAADMTVLGDQMTTAPAKTE
ncbi:MAG: LysM peptidoglycan-binding domain-containing protein [Mesorhizobium sp.]|nr:LysM peptidoglycan-binding domain-containing protein [Mesorhizobium sp.]